MILIIKYMVGRTGWAVVPFLHFSYFSFSTDSDRSRPPLLALILLALNSRLVLLLPLVWLTSMVLSISSTLSSTSSKLPPLS